MLENKNINSLNCAATLENLFGIDFKNIRLDVKDLIIDVKEFVEK